MCTSHSSVDGHLGYLHFLSMMNKAIWPFLKPRWHFLPLRAQAHSSFLPTGTHTSSLPPPPPPLSVLLSLPPSSSFCVISPPPPASAKEEESGNHFQGTLGRPTEHFCSPCRAWDGSRRDNLILLTQPQGRCVGTGPCLGNSFSLRL